MTWRATEHSPSATSIQLRQPSRRPSRDDIQGAVARPEASNASQRGERLPTLAQYLLASHGRRSRTTPSRRRQSTSASGYPARERGNGARPAGRRTGAAPDVTKQEFIERYYERTGATWEGHPDTGWCCRAHAETTLARAGPWCGTTRSPFWSTRTGQMAPSGLAQASRLAQSLRKAYRRRTSQYQGWLRRRHATASTEALSCSLRF